MRQWISSCAEKHDACDVKPGYTPTRLICVDSKCGSTHVHLIDSRDTTHEKKDIAYVALSHCWGSVADRHPLRTTRATLDAHMNGIQYDDLPKTFQDAVRITRSLGVRYIWIDSLCIIQDDDKDWQREAARMALVFRHAFVTVTASSARNAYDGCSVDLRLPSTSIDVQASKSRQDPLVAPITTITSQNRHRSGDRTATPVRRFNFRLADGMPTYGCSFEQSLLQSRGWVFQEAYLSRRVIHFCEDKMYWQCRELFESEDGFHSRKEQDLEHPVRVQPLVDLEGLRDYYLMFRSWWRFIALYSRRHFSFWKDRIPAFAGATKEYQAVVNDRPVVGLWERDLLIQLIWEPGNAIEVAGLGDTHELPYVPSWSWFSLPAEAVGYIMDSLFTISDKKGISSEAAYSARVVDINIQWTGESLTSPLKCATLAIEAEVVKRSLVLGADGLYDFRWRRYEYHRDDGRAEQYWCVWDVDGLVKTVDIVIVRLFTDELEGEYSEQSEIYCTCLAVVPTGVRPNEYRRFGLIQILRSGPMPQNWGREVLCLV